MDADLVLARGTLEGRHLDLVGAAFLETFREGLGASRGAVEFPDFLAVGVQNSNDDVDADLIDVAEEEAVVLDLDRVEDRRRALGEAARYCLPDLERSLLRERRHAQQGRDDQRAHGNREPRAEMHSLPLVAGRSSEEPTIHRGIAGR